MIADRLQRQRFELKYHLRPDEVPAVREFLGCHLELDAFSAAQPDRSYPVHSLYLDSPDLRLCRATINGDRDRFKLRLRSYAHAPADPVYFEIKRRANDCILKQRAAVRRSAVPALLAGDWPRSGHLVEPDDRGLQALQTFCRLVQELRARPRAQVTYLREAWTSPDNNAVRVTFDRAVRCAPQTDSGLGQLRKLAVPVFGEMVILEVKFTDSFPRWIGELVETFDLMRGSAAKYVDGLTLACGPTVLVESAHAAAGALGRR